MHNDVVNDVSYAGLVMRGDILGLERRRRWCDEEKLEIVLSVGVGGATVGAFWKAAAGASPRACTGAPMNAEVVAGIRTSC